MIGLRQSDATALALVPFALKLKGGWLVGYAADPKAGSPCAGCVENWLNDRNVAAKRASVDELPRDARRALESLEGENSPHVFYELTETGQKTRLDCLVFPHVRCSCQKGRYQPPAELGPKTNLAFSPVFQLKCVRYGTPSGNLWFFTAIGQAPLTLKLAAAHGAHPDREVARFLALETWMKRVASLELRTRLEIGEQFGRESLDGEAVDIRQPSPEAQEFVGVGETRDAAVKDSLYQLARWRTLKEFANSGKNPMLIVGANSWLRQKVPFFLLQQYDLYPLFYPNASPTWVVGVGAFSRMNASEPPIFMFGCDSEIGKALDKAIYQLLEVCRPADWRSDPFKNKEGQQDEKGAKLNLWWTRWIYRCPKISLKDVLHLEKHPSGIDTWASYLQGFGGLPEVTPLNHPLLPAAIRRLTRVEAPQMGGPVDVPRNVKGIGTWSAFRDLLSNV